MVVGFTVIAIANIRLNHNKIQFREIEIKSQEVRLKEINQQYEEILKSHTETEAERRQQSEKIKQLEAERERLQSELQAKRDKQRLDKENLAQAVRSSLGENIAYAGGCEAWIAQAGIVDTINAIELIRRESNCNPNAVNGSSGACGVAQELPCGKSGCVLGDGACQVRWMNDYVQSRYGSWANAVAFHDRMNWY